MSDVVPQFDYPCPDCRATSSLHDADCEFEGRAWPEIERAYTDIVAELTAGPAAEPALYDAVDGEWGALHRAALERLRRDERVTERNDVLRLRTAAEFREQVSEPTREPMRTLYRRGSVPGCHDNAVFARIAGEEMVGLPGGETRADLGEGLLPNGGGARVDVSPPAALPCCRGVDDPAARAELAEEWGIEPPAVPGLTDVEMTHAFGDQVRAAIVLGENPAATEPDGNSVADHFEELEFLVCIDLFETETTQYADVILPGSAWAEKGGTVTNTDRQVLRMRRMTDPPGEARRDLDIVASLGERLADRPFPSDPATVFEELTRVSPIYAGMSYDGIDDSEAQGASGSRTQSGDGGQRWPYPAGADSGTDVLHRGRFANGDRTAPLVPVDHVPPAATPADDELVLTTGRIITHFNSGALTRRSETLTAMAGEDALRIHPDDAADRGIDDGEAVRVASDRGTVTAPADVTPAVRRGTVFLTFHFAESPVNRVTADALDPTAKIPEYKHTPVTVEPE